MWKFRLKMAVCWELKIKSRFHRYGGAQWVNLLIVGKTFYKFRLTPKLLAKVPISAVLKDCYATVHGTFVNMTSKIFVRNKQFFFGCCEWQNGQNSVVRMHAVSDLRVKITIFFSHVPISLPPAVRNNHFRITQERERRRRKGKGGVFKRKHKQSSTLIHNVMLWTKRVNEMQEVKLVLTPTRSQGENCFFFSLLSFLPKTMKQFVKSVK